MSKSTWFGHAKPKEHTVQVRGKRGKREYVYAHIQKKELSNDMVFYKLMHQVAKVTLRTVKYVFNLKNKK